MCIKLKRLSAMFATVLVIFSVSLVPCYAEDSNGADMYLYLAYPTVDPYTMSPYAVPQYKFQQQFSNTFNSAASVYLGVASSTFPAISTSGTQPTVYWSYYAQAITGTSTTVPAWTGLKTPTGYAYYINGTKTAITATVVNNAVIGGQGRQLIMRTTLPHNTVRFTFTSNDTTNGVGFNAVAGGSYDFGFGFAYVVNADDDTISLLDEVITLLTSIDSELDTQTELLNSFFQYFDRYAQQLDDIGQSTYNIYDILKNALATESGELSDAASHLGDQMLQKADAEQYWNDKSDEAFDGLGLNDFSFPDDTSTAFSWVGQVFTQMWQFVSSGGVIFIWTFPLMLGIALTVLGRIARSGGGKKDKGDKDG